MFRIRASHYFVSYPKIERQILDALLCAVYLHELFQHKREKNGVQFSNIRYQTVFCFWAGVIDEI